MAVDSNIESTVGRAKESLLLGSPLSDSVGIDEKFLNVMLMWSEANFSRFAFDVVALFAGKYQPGMLSSLHGISWMNPERNRAV